MIKVFICMPYGDDNSLEQREHNTKRALDVFHMLADDGFIPICPHLSHFAHEHRNRPRDWWLTHSMLQMDTCDCVIMFHGNDGPTEGMTLEILRANQNKQPVFGLVSEIKRAYGLGEES